MKLENLIITGIHRSGTTLACWLINQVRDAVALVEPMKVSQMIGRDVRENITQIHHFFQTERASIPHSGMATMKQLNHELPINLYEEKVNESGMRSSFVALGSVPIAKTLNPDFLLAIKHNAAFCALLPSLIQEFYCLGIVRNPLAILLSWNSLDIQVRKGRLPIGQALDPKLDYKIRNAHSVLEKQFIILDWFFHQLTSNLSNTQIISYEDIISSNGNVLFDFLNLEIPKGIDLRSKNTNELYPRDMVSTLTTLLLERDGAYKVLYTEEDILSLSESYYN